MKSVRCSGYRVSDNKRCAKRVFPNSQGHGMCLMHESQSANVIPRSTIRCDICFDDMDISENANFECGHFFHLSCAKNLRDARCPVCRSEIRSKKFTPEDIAEIEARGLHDKRERDSQFITPSNFDDDINDEFEFEFDFEFQEHTTIPELYQKFINDYSVMDINSIPVLTVILSIIGSINVLSQITNIPIPSRDIEEWMIRDLAILYPNEDQSLILEAIHLFI